MKFCLALLLLPAFAFASPQVSPESPITPPVSENVAVAAVAPVAPPEAVKIAPAGAVSVQVVSVGPSGTKTLLNTTVRPVNWETGVFPLGSTHTSVFQKNKDNVEGRVKEVERPVSGPDNLQVIASAKPYVMRHKIFNGPEEEIEVGMYTVETRLVSFVLNGNIYISGTIDDDGGINRHSFEGVDVEVPSVSRIALQVEAPVGSAALKTFEQFGVFYKVTVTPVK